MTPEVTSVATKHGSSAMAVPKRFIGSDCQHRHRQRAVGREGLVVDSILCKCPELIER
jgi:hypothetical protein